MKLKRIRLKNFRRLEDIAIDFEDNDTVFVGPNNSGKTSATAAFRLFLVRPAFTVYDFSVSRIAELNAFGLATDEDVETAATSLPAIEMDLWFSINPEIEFGRVFSLVPNISAALDEVGVRLTLSVKDAQKLKADFLSQCPAADGGPPPKTLSQFLSLPTNLSRHFGLCYFALESSENEPIPTPLEPEEGKRVLRSLIRVDFVDAQRNIDDQEIGRSNRLSAAFAAFYKKNLEQADISQDANRIIDENNDRLTAHYEAHFNELFEVIRGLGVPSVNDRQLKLISSISPELALQGNTSLLYVDPVLSHELPETYNGLGFKNLIYMAIQISHFHLQWMKTELERPLCQIIFVEEPEVHLHAQVQQTFVSNIWDIVKKASVSAGETHMVPQLAITTHSSHILDAVEFRKIRYFRRCLLAGETPTATSTLNASKALSLRTFKPKRASAAGAVETEEDTLAFLKQYLKLTHCDLFFADAAVLVEGTVEKLLLPMMIDQSAPGLKRNYLTVLEVGGAYSHRFASLLEFLGIPYLVITDLDAVDPANRRATCRADTPGALTSNASLTFFLNKTKVSDIAGLVQHTLADNCCFVAFQKPSIVSGYDKSRPMHGRTFEETFAYENMQLLRDKKIPFGAELATPPDHEQEYAAVYNRVQSSTFRKTEFALDLASSPVAWVTPTYIAEGLSWLEQKVAPAATNPGDK